MRLRDAEEAVVDRQLVGEVQVGAADAAAKRGLQTAGTEGNVLLGVGKEEAG